MFYVKFMVNSKKKKFSRFRQIIADARGCVFRLNPSQSVCIYCVSRKREVK
jgi:hypothetical protein